MEDAVDINEITFHNAVRGRIIWFLLFILFYVSSYSIIGCYHRKSEKDDINSGDCDDAFVYRITLWICTFTLAVSGGSALLLPMSIVANEVLLMYPRSYYLQWVKGSLIHGLWNLIFLCSNLSLFVFLPFAYFFIESEGFPGLKKGIKPRIIETIVLLILLIILIFGIGWVISALIGNDQHSKKTLFDLWNFYLPMTYSFISLLGVLLLLLCTPVGFARLFTVLGELIKPEFLRNLDEEIITFELEEETLTRRIHCTNSSSATIANGNTSVTELEGRLENIQKNKVEIENRRKIPSWRRQAGYPLAIIFLWAMTIFSVILVLKNTLELLIGLKGLPKGVEDISLGISSLSTLGPLGATIEVVIIIYFMLASIVGFYSLPLCHKLQPKLHDTPITKIVWNCSFLLIMSSALPILSRTLGITNFDLLGHFGSMDWLGNFYIILSYNLIFAVATGLSLLNKASSIAIRIRNRSILNIQWNSSFSKLLNLQSVKNE